MAFCEDFIIVDSSDGIFVKTFDGVSKNRTYEEVRDEVLYAAAKTICFEDCYDEVVKDIYVGGHKLEYMGWQPGMLFEFCDDKGRIVWSRRFPEWDH